MPDDLRKLREELHLLQKEQRLLGERLKKISERLALMDHPGEGAALRAEPGTPPTEIPPSAEPGDKPTEAAAPPHTVSPSFPAQKSRDLEARIGGVWLNRVGMLVFLLGAAFFLKLAYDWGWIDETVRIAVGILAAAVLLWLGERNRRRGFSAYGQGLTGGGIALLYFTIFASFYYYELISDSTGMSLLILVTIGAVLLALYQNARAVAVLGLLTGFLNPALFVAEEPRFALMMLYLILLNLGLMAMVYFKRWRFLGTISFFLTGGFLVWTVLYRLGNPALGLPVTAAQLYFTIFLLLFLAPLLLCVIVQRRPLEPPELGLMITGAAFYYGLSWLNLHGDYPDAVGWFTLALAALYLLVGFLLLPASRRDPRAYFTAFALSAALLVLFVPLQLKDCWIFVAWSLQAALLCYLGLRLADRRIHPGFWFVLSLALLRLLSVEWDRYYQPDHFRFLLNRTALLTFGFMLLLLFLSSLYHRYLKESSPPKESLVLAGAAGVLLLLFCSLELERLGQALAWRTGAEDYYQNIALLAISLFWGVYAAALMIAGFIRKLPLLRYAAIGLFGLTVAKVLLFDLSFLELAYRIISLVISGLILLGVSYLYQRHRDRIGPPA
ncbi:MAG: DUF2339 domain-containing protein [Firmicutes bacterium]|nr:DUF2339 domain-containing protein [Bacillota bacterium]